jgi:hypothetical protein
METLEKEQAPERQNEVRMEMLKSEINKLGQENLEDFLNQLEEKDLGGFKNEPVTLRIAFSIFFHQDEMGPDGPAMIDIERIREQYERKKRLLNEMKFRARDLNILANSSYDINGNEFSVFYRIQRIIETYDDAYEMIFRHVRMYERINHPTYQAVPLDFDKSIERYNSVNDLATDEEDARTPYQKLLLYLLTEANRRKYKRYNGFCYREIKTPDGKSTRAWEPVMEISDFVYTMTQKEDKYDMWKNMTARGGNVRETIAHLTSCKDIQFPDIKKERTVWSFQNGLFAGRAWDEASQKYMAKFYPYDKPEFDQLDPTVVSCKYFAQEFVDHSDIKDWYDIPTPFMQSIMDYQKFPEDVCRWLYVFGGRLCFDVNDIDRWQVIGFLKGIARSGKSTLITKVFKKFYESEDVRTLSNNVEKKFGLEALHDGFMFISPEVKGDMALEQAEFQSLVSGEDLSIARKFKKAISVTWKVPGILAGNEVPGWKDNSGSILRRLLTWNFARQVAEADPHLEDKLDTEIPIILEKCVKAYLEYAQKYGDQDIWNVVPKYFKTIQSQVAMVTNILQNFLSSEKVQFGDDLCVPQKVFVAVFNQHCHENNLGRAKFNPDFYAGPFSSRNLEVRNETKTYKGRAYTNQPFIFGVDTVQEALDVSDDF